MASHPAVASYRALRCVYLRLHGGALVTSRLWDEAIGHVIHDDDAGTSAGLAVKLSTPLCVEGKCKELS